MINYNEIINLLENSIEIIGVFVAIIIELVVSRILSNKEEKEKLNVKIKDNQKELNIMKEEFNKLKKEHYEIYKKDTEINNYKQRFVLMEL